MTVATKPIAVDPQAEMDAALDDILGRWHDWQDRVRVARGFAPKSLVVGDYVTSRQYDDTNGALDDALENRTMQAVQVTVQQMQDPYRTAVYVIARACCTGTWVFASPRLPKDKGARDVLFMEARAQAITRLVGVGVLSWV